MYGKESHEAYRDQQNNAVEMHSYWSRDGRVIVNVQATNFMDLMDEVGMMESELEVLEDRRKELIQALKARENPKVESKYPDV